LLKIKSTVIVIIFVIVTIALASVTIGGIIGFPTLAFTGEQ
jgi:hypothetical protein